MWKEVDIGQLSEGDIGKRVKVAGWVHELRLLGKIAFIILRDWSGKIQITVKGNDEALEKAKKLNREDVIAVEGTVGEKRGGGIEILAERLEVLNEVKKKLPVDPTGEVPSELDTRLTYRFLDTRKPEVLQIFRVRSELANAFREFFHRKGFVEIHPSTIVAEATEGGAEVFPVQYFEYKAFLAQSPQLYKQMAVIGGIERAFMISYIYRAEKHNTTTHLNEAVAMDIEMAFADHMDVMKLQEEALKHMLSKAAEVDERVKPIEKVEYITYDEALSLLKEHGRELEWGEDLSREDEKLLSSIVGEAFFIYEWPTMQRAFYSMPKEGREEVCNAFDLIYRGLEISSGAQRIHRVEMLEEALRKRGLDPINFEFYLEAFRYGAPPHAGWSIGLDRLTMKALGLSNIREAVLFPRDRHRLKP